MRPYPGADRATRVLADGGNLPRWSPDGRRAAIEAVNVHVVLNFLEELRARDRGN